MPANTLSGGTVVADRVNASQFYYWTENSSDNQWILYTSTDAGRIKLPRGGSRVCLLAQKEKCARKSPLDFITLAAAMSAGEHHHRFSY